MKKISKEVEAIMLERFGKDSIIALATANILCIKLTNSILFSNGTRYEVDFTE